MKHTILYLFIIIAALVFAGCASKSHKANTKQNTKASEPVQIIIEDEEPVAEETTPVSGPSISVNHSFLSEEHVGQTFSIKGYLSQNGDNFILTENPGSKSRVTFYLEIADASLITKATALVNTTVEVTGVLTQAQSPWSKRMKVQKIN
ncbi:MAG: hypothetical protein J5726_03940 [Treponema sp.]|nr:hypothetical protein [Treponema sp.]